MVAEDEGAPMILNKYGSTNTRQRHISDYITPDLKTIQILDEESTRMFKRIASAKQVEVTVKGFDYIHNRI